MFLLTEDDVNYFNLLNWKTQVTIGYMKGVIFLIVNIKLDKIY